MRSMLFLIMGVDLRMRNVYEFVPEKNRHCSRSDLPRQNEIVPLLRQLG